MDREKDNILESVSYRNSSISIDFYDSSLVYIINKTERIVTAIYLITNFINSSEPLKRDIRDISNKVIKDISFLNKSHGSVDIRHSSDIQTNIFYLDSLLKLALRTDLITEMNCKIIRDELSHLSREIESRDKKPANDPSLKKTYFNFEKEVSVKKAPNRKHKGHSQSSVNVLNKQSEQTMSPIKSNTRPLFESPKSSLSLSNNVRIENILSIIDELNTVNIKDLSNRISGVSSKTLQRDLISLVSNNVLKKEGERRWSIYSRA